MNDLDKLALDDCYCYDENGVFIELCFKCDNLDLDSYEEDKRERVILEQEQD